MGGIPAACVTATTAQLAQSAQSMKIGVFIRNSFPSKLMVLAGNNLARPLPL
jgi:hypothetical protein